MTSVAECDRAPVETYLVNYMARGRDDNVCAFVELGLLLIMISLGSLSFATLPASSKEIVFVTRYGVGSMNDARGLSNFVDIASCNRESMCIEGLIWGVSHARETTHIEGATE